MFLGATSLRIPPFGGAPGDQLESFLGGSTVTSAGKSTHQNRKMR